MKNLVFISSLVISTACASAATTYTVIDFGPNGTTTMIGTINQFATSNAVAQKATNMVLKTTTGSDSGIRFTTDTSILASGDAGSFSPAGSTAYTGGSSVIDGWRANEQVLFGDIWQGAANAANGPTTGQVVNFTFSGLAANTEYTFKLLSGRANTFTGVDGTEMGLYRMVYGDTINGDPILAGGGSHAFQGSAAGLNATEYTWSFTTGDTVKTATLNLSGSWNINALVISATPIDVIPEPSSLALLGLGGLGLFRRRRS